MSSFPLPLPPTHTQRFLNLSKNDLEIFDKLVYATSASEQRGNLPVWGELKSAGSTSLIEVTVDDENFDVIKVRSTGTDRVVVLQDIAGLELLLRGNNTCIDISGLPHHVWAPLLLAARRASTNVSAIYAEPEKYKPHSSPVSPTQFDLSLTYRGLQPLPGFVNLAGPPDDDSSSILVALLGFEGNRPKLIAYELDSEPRVVPIIGVPGFRLEYPAFTVECNKAFLAETQSHSQIRKARASCPFETINTLNQIHQDFPEHHMYLAPVGTKPHSLGAIWFAIHNPSFTEILYDHPIRKKGRTDGVGTIHLYDLSGGSQC